MMCKLILISFLNNKKKMLLLFYIILLFNIFNLIKSQTYGNLTYNVLDIVKSIHNYPHLNKDLTKTTNTFNIDINNIHNSYSESVIILPIILTCFIFIIFLLFELNLCCRICFQCCNCIDNIPKRTSINSMALWTDKITKSRISLIRAFWVFILLTLIISQGIIFTGIFLIKGGNKGIDSTNNLYDIAIELEDSGENLDTSGNIVLSLTTEAVPTCSQASYVQNYADDFNTYVADYMDIIEPIPNDLNKVEDFITKYGLNIATIAIWSTYAGLIISVFFIIIAYLSRNKIAVKISIGWGLLIIHCVLVCWCIFTIATIVLADFCMKPTDNALLIAPDSALEVATYYSTCNGTNPFDESISLSYEALNDLNTSITILVRPGGVCENNPYLLSCFGPINDMYANLTIITDNTVCEPLQSEWGNVFNDAICYDYFISLYILFYTLILLIISFFPLLVISSLLYQYFGALWKTEEGHVLEIPIRDSEGNPLSSLPGVSLSREAMEPSSTYSTLIYDDSRQTSTSGVSLSSNIPPSPVRQPPPAYSLTKEYV